MKRSLVELVFLGLLSLSAANVMADGAPQSYILPELPENQEMLVVEVNLEPGEGSSPHRHNAYVFVYILEGKVNMQVDGQEMVTLSPGEMFYENPDNIHMVSQNASDTETAKFLVHLIRTAGTPVSVPVE